MAAEEKQMLENAVPKSTRSVNKWAMKIVSEWQATRIKKKAIEEESSCAVDTSQIQDLTINVADMTAESLNLWLTKFIMGVCKDTGEHYPARTLYSIVSGIQRHLEDCIGANAFRLLGKTEHR
jgi:hypothetical protein